MKACRNQILQCLDANIRSSSHKENEELCESFKKDHDHESAEDELDDHLKTEICTRFEACMSKVKIPGKKSDMSVQYSEPGQVYIVDDNMYYSSMRYQYFQLARKCK